ncbi:hypothetical protein GCM10009718_06650 [Isoptericola halotolerans]|uniref:Uncharacterized protein n=1 Tax=Isoptericola halotolerans TaxID=300560 RepID=A0ABX2A0Q3_9MICO|nr:hypothetical protein [Isoptericola halotolerans]NOV96413.1 hypothetical protein [Isoptericola halotolerans]
MTLQAATPVTASVIGQVPAEYEGEGPRAYLLVDHMTRWFPDSVSADNYRFWVPPDRADELATVLARDLTAAGAPFSVD